MGIYLAYARTSTTEQHLDRQLASIRGFCKERKIELFRDKIYCDQCTGKNFDRPEYKMIKEILRSGDCLIVSEMDRLGRTKKGIMEELKYFRDNNIRVIFLDIPTTQMEFEAMDNEVSRLMLEVINNVLIETFATMAEAEMHKREKRQREGIEAMKEAGEWEKYGRPRKLSFDEFRPQYRRVEMGDITPFQLIKELGIPKSTFYRYRDEYFKNGCSVIGTEII